jgi:hypothetical protein
MRYGREVGQRLTALALVVLSLFVVPGAYAQSDTSQISGIVKDATGGVVPGATVTVTNEATQVQRTAETNANGFFVVSSIPSGFYTVTVESPGFKRFVKTANKLDASIPLMVDALLEVGAVTETVEVVASVAGVQTETATVGRTVEAQQIDKLILNGRNPVLLALLKPGVRRGSSMASFSFSMNSGGYAINGSRSQDNLITHDGAVATRTRSNGTAIGAVDLDQVQEIQILTANFKAEYGRSAGGQIRIVTKSGSQDFHGSFYEYFRNDNLDANSFNNNRNDVVKAAHKFNQFGYIVNGPITLGSFNRDRTKWFFSWGQEWVRRRVESSAAVTVPSLAMRGGDFSELLGPNTFFTGTRTIRDPDTGEAFANNVIPTSRLSPNGVGLLNAYPEPTAGFLQGTNNRFLVRPQPTDQRKDTVAVDFNPNQSHAFRFRFQNYNFAQLDAFRGDMELAVTDWDRPNKTASLNYIWTVSPTIVNEMLITGSVDRVFIDIQRDGLRFARSQFGIDYPYLFSDPKEIDDKVPTIVINGLGTVDGGPYPASSTGPIYQIGDNLSVIKSNHTLKFGVLWARQGQNDFDQINVSGVPGGTNNQNGRFEFIDNRVGGSGLAMGDAALGLFDRYAEIGTRAFTPYRSTSFEYFVQDSWRVNDRLTVEAGVRHLFTTPYYYSLWRNMAVFDTDSYDPSRAVVQDPETGNILSGDRFNGVRIPGDGWTDAAFGRVRIADTGEYDHLFTGGNKYWGDYQKGNIMPRFGMAYRINEKTVFRAGGGKFYASVGVADNIFLGGNPPFQPMASVSRGVADEPGGGSAVAFPQFFMTNDPVYKIPSAWNWNFTVQREIGYNTTVEVAYVGRVGTHMERTRELNALPVGTRNTTPSTVNTNFLRPYKGFAFINLGENAARSEYNGLQIELNRRFSNGFGYGLAYTLSESFDNASDRRQQPWDPFNDTTFWGHSSFDTRHVAVINFIWEIPFLRGSNSLAAKILGGWELSGVAQFQTGSPTTITTGDDFAGIGGGPAQPWNLNGDPDLPRGERAYADTNAEDAFWWNVGTPENRTFTRPAAGTFTTSQFRNMLYNVGFQNWNLGVFKVFSINERHAFQLRGEFFNFPNHPNWSNPNANPTAATFGKVTGKTSERNVQLSLRYSF